MKILYEDKNTLAIEKQPGIPVADDKTLDTSLQKMAQQYTNIADLGLINRLDRPVGGIVLFGKNKATTAYLTGHMKNKKIIKKYKVVVIGKVIENENTFQDYLLKNQRLNKSKVVFKNSPGGKFAELSYKKIGEKSYKDNILTFLEINLGTGRHHQIRVQLASRNLGIYGDEKYNRGFSKMENGIALWASELSFFKYNENNLIEIKSDLPNLFPFNLF